MGDCADILVKGVYDEFHYSNLNEYQLDMVFVLTHSKHELQQLKDSNSTDLTLGVKKLIDLGFSDDSSDEQVHQLAEQLKIDQHSTLNFSNLTNVTLKVVDKSVVEAWKECVTHDAGIKTEVLSQPKEGEQFIVRVIYRPMAVTDASVLKINGVSLVGATYAGETVLKAGATLGSFSSVSQVFRRSGKQAIAIAVDFAGDGGVIAKILEIPDVVVAPPPETQKYTLSSMKRDYVPPKVGGGNADFDTHADEPMTVHASAQVEIWQQRNLVVRLSMHAKESRPDWTEVNGQTSVDDEQYRLYTAPGVEPYGDYGNSALKSLLSQ